MAGQLTSRSVESNTIHPLTTDRHRIHYAITIQKPPEVVYAFWRDLANLPRFCKDLIEVQPLSERDSHWIAQLKSGRRAEWDAVITEDIRDRGLSWTSIGRSQVKTKGSIFFDPTPDGVGTVVRLSMDFSIPGGKLSEWLTFLSGEDPETLMATNLKRLKAYLESGEIPTTEGQPTGRAPAKTITH